jgi:hypothetical protein
MNAKTPEAVSPEDLAADQFQERWWYLRDRLDRRWSNLDVQASSDPAAEAKRRTYGEVLDLMDAIGKQTFLVPNPSRERE